MSYEQSRNVTNGNCELIEYVVWNPAKLAKVISKHKAWALDDYRTVVNFETETGTRLSSSIFVRDEEHLSAMLEAMYDETDCMLCTHRVSC